MTKEKTVQSETLDLDFVSFRLATTFYGLRWFKSLGKLTSGFDFFFFFLTVAKHNNDGLPLLGVIIVVLCNRA
jgi:hypothetical protein